MNSLSYKIILLRCHLKAPVSRKDMFLKKVFSLRKMYTSRASLQERCAKEFIHEVHCAKTVSVLLIVDHNMMIGLEVPYAKLDHSAQ